jgi:hypothetical protein
MTLTNQLSGGQIKDEYIDGEPEVPSLRSLGTGAQQAAAGDHTHGDIDLSTYPWQIQVITLLNIPPEAPTEGDRYIIGGGPTGAWAGHSYEVVVYHASAWVFYTPQDGWVAWDMTYGHYRVYYTGSSPQWQQLDGTGTKVIVAGEGSDAWAGHLAVWGLPYPTLGNAGFKLESPLVLNQFLVASDATGAFRWRRTDLDDVRAILDSVPMSLPQDILDPTGWVAPDSISVAYNATTRKITLTGTLDYYWRGTKHTLTSPWTSDAHLNSDNYYYLYSDDGDIFSWSTTPWGFDDLMVARVAKSSSPAFQFALREVHAAALPWQVHQLAHAAIGTYVKSGGSLTAGTYTENTASDSATTPGVDAAVVKDEDCETTIAAWPQDTYTTLRIGASSKATFDTAATFPFRSSGSYILLNDPATGSEAASADGNFVNLYQIFIPTTAEAGSQAYRVVWLQPQRAFTSLAAAQAEDPRKLLLGDLSTITDEWVIHTRITYALASGNTNTGKCKIATGGVTYLTTPRAGQVEPGTGAPTAENVPFAPAGTIAATNVQSAVVEVQADLAADIAVVAGDVATLSGNVSALSSSVSALESSKAPLESPALTGAPTAPTPAVGDNDTSIATTAYVQAELALRWHSVKKSSDETIQSDNTLNTDGALVFSTASNTKYHIRGRIYFDTSAAADFKYRFQNSGTTTLLRGLTIHVVPGTSTLVPTVETGAPTTTQAVTGTGTNGGYIEFDFILHQGATAGGFSFQWCQNTSDASNTTVRAGSFLEYLIM